MKQSTITADSILETVHLVTCVGVDTEYAHLPHFIAHYRALGVPGDNCHVIVNSDDADSPNLERAAALLREHGVGQPIRWIAPYTSDSMWAQRRSVQQQYVPAEHWVLSADVDEFHEYPEPLADFLRRCESRGITCVQGVFIDRLAPGGELLPVADDRPIAETFPIEADVQCRITGTGEHHNWYGTVKLMAMKGDLFPGRGGHVLETALGPVNHFFGRQLAAFRPIGQAWFRFRVPLRVHHYKWTASMAATLRRRLATPGVSLAGGEYSRKLVDYVDRHGRIRFEDVALRSSYRWTARGWRQRTAALRALNALHWYVRKPRRIARRLTRGSPR